ncbi:MAG: flagellar motor protein MotB [Candidatus Deferrimicrobiaceae bacterium]
MARKKKPEEHANHERWLVSYADFITLLFAFFTTMYAISTADTAKLQKLVGSMQGAFGGEVTKIMPESGKTPFATEMPNVSPGTPLAFNVARTEADVFHGIQDRIGKYLVKGIDEGKVLVIVSDRGLVIRLSEEGLFTQGDAEIKPAAREILDELALSLIDSPNFVRIEGHTDAVPVKSARFPSNWELSTARASRIVRWFIERQHFPPGRLSAAGFGEYRPAATNSTAEGRKANRRVEIIVLRNRLAITEP